MSSGANGSDRKSPLGAPRLRGAGTASRTLAHGYNHGTDGKEASEEMEHLPWEIRRVDQKKGFLMEGEPFFAVVGQFRDCPNLREGDFVRR